MIRTIFHGSESVIEKPVFGFGKSYNDYGLGFYCTDSLDMAKEWASAKDRDGFANQYTIDTDSLSVLNLNEPRFCILHWLAVLLENRQFTVTAPLALQAREYILSVFHVDYRDADCMIGYRADDSYFAFAQDFINGAISYRQLNHAMHLGKLGQQFVLKSQKAFDRITFVQCHNVSGSEWYEKRMARDRSARNDYLNIERYRVLPGDLFMPQIISEEMTPDDPRLQSDLP